MTLRELRKKFAAQKSDARRRGILFLLTFDQWHDIWKTSGRLRQRGNGRGRYVMARYGDRGNYEPSNVRIILFEENCREYRPTLNTRIRIGAAHRGKIVSAKTRKKIAVKAKARRPSLVARAKMSISGKRVAHLRNRDESGRFA